MFVKRFISTIILLGIFSAIIFGNFLVSSISFLILGSLLSFFTPYETCNMLKQSGRPVFAKTVSAVCLLSFLAAYFYYLPEMQTYSFIITAFLIFSAAAVPWILLLFIIGKEGGLERIFTSCGVCFLFILPFLMLVNIYISGVEVLLFFVIGTKIGDIGAYVVGTLTNKLMKNGNHKMIPSISPGKSWEGAAGGMLASIVFSVCLFSRTFPGVTAGYWLPAVVGIFLFIFGAAGDLAESCIKRVCGVKDSGRTIPGIGGVFDLVDSLLLNSVIFGTFLFLLLIL